MIDYKELTKIEILASMPPEDLILIAEISTEENFKSDDIVFAEDASANKLYLLKEGRIGIFMEIPANRKMLIEKVESGGVFGWSSIIPPYKYSSTAQCIEDSKVVSVDGKRLKGLFLKNCRFGYIFMEHIADIMSLKLKLTRLQFMHLMKW